MYTEFNTIFKWMEYLKQQNTDMVLINYTTHKA
jgi:hypothetical protein